MKLIAKNINKKIHGRDILCDVSLNLESENIYGFVGKNGSGKTMLFRALSGLMRIDSGSIEIDEMILHRDISVLPQLGIILENASLYSDFTGMQNLEYLASMKKKVGKYEIIEAINRVGLDPNDKRKYGKYSLGMKQRLAVAQAIMEKPEVIMLDEPTNALDESGVNLIRKIIIEERDRGALILLASHNKEDISVLADKLYKVEDGHVIELEDVVV